MDFDQVVPASYPGIRYFVEMVQSDVAILRLDDGKANDQMFDTAKLEADIASSFAA